MCIDTDYRIEHTLVFPLVLCACFFPPIFCAVTNSNACKLLADNNYYYRIIMQTIYQQLLHNTHTHTCVNVNNLEYLFYVKPYREVWMFLFSCIYHGGEFSSSWRVETSVVRYSRLTIPRYLSSIPTWRYQYRQGHDIPRYIVAVQNIVSRRKYRSIDDTVQLVPLSNVHAASLWCWNE